MPCRLSKAEKNIFNIRDEPFFSGKWYVCGRCWSKPAIALLTRREAAGLAATYS